VIDTTHRADVLAWHDRIGQALPDLPATVTTIAYYPTAPVVTVAGDRDVLTDAYGDPGVFDGSEGGLYRWTHPDGFYVELFTPRRTGHPHAIDEAARALQRALVVDGYTVSDAIADRAVRVALAAFELHDRQLTLFDEARYDAEHGIGSER
jgi:N-acetyl-anhydromuramyl-L-alanine amidase AmpD